MVRLPCQASWGFFFFVLCPLGGYVLALGWCLPPVSVFHSMGMWRSHVSVAVHHSAFQLGLGANQMYTEDLPEGEFCP